MEKKEKCRIDQKRSSKGIWRKYFGPYEGEDLNMRVRVEGLADRDEGYKVHSRLSDMFLELGIDVLHPIARA